MKLPTAPARRLALPLATSRGEIAPMHLRGEGTPPTSNQFRRRGRSALFAALAGLACQGLSAQPLIVSTEETKYAPTRVRIDAVLAAAKRDGWAPQVRPLRTAALAAYTKGNLGAAESWLHVYAWASLLGRTEAEFVQSWVRAVNTAQVGHPNMPRDYPRPLTPLGAHASPALQSWVLNDAAFSAQFFGLTTPVDYLPRVLGILDTLQRANAERFRTYSSLALAIAVVYDVAPPPIWPHNQVSAAALPRKFAEPSDAFAWWVRQDQAGRTAHRLSRLGAYELKFVVDTPAPPSELEWAQAHVAMPLDELGRAYTMVKYRNERVLKNQPVWPADRYRLTDILTAGGICADQAYFSVTAGKARGIPTLFFQGAGNDARHAWFGFLDSHQRWQLDAGRYADRSYVTGFARDPQTWLEFSDHELQFLKENFRSTVAYRHSRVHAAFAADMLAAGEAKDAATAARNAVKYEPRNRDGWETLLEATRRQGAEPKMIEVILREAALAFQRYPDLEAYYVAKVAESLRGRGQTSAAEAEVNRIARRHQLTRVDISVQQAKDIVLRAMRSQPLDGQVRAYNSVVDTYGPTAGIGFFDEVVRTFVEHLVQLGHRAEALRAWERARRTLQIEPKSQLEREFDELRKAAEKGR